MDMKYFKSKENEVFAYAADGSEDSFILPGLVEIDGDELAKIRAAQSRLLNGKTRQQVEIARLSAYANPVTGSDRFLAEVIAERLQKNEAKAKEAELKLLKRRKEIAAENPWPIED